MDGAPNELQVRASDGERDAAVTALRDHAAAGRLGLDELEERIQAALTATTRADLETLFADLPERPSPRPRPRRRQAAPTAWVWAGGLTAGLVGVAVAGEPWVLWFLFGWPWLFGHRKAGCPPFRRMSAR
jgi:hypothetical protein